MPKSKSFLSYENQWESHIYRIEKEQIKKMAAVKIGGKRYKIDGRLVTVPYNDMGHEYTATSMQFFALMPVAGVTLPIALNELIERKVKIEPLDYEV